MGDPATATIIGSSIIGGGNFLSSMFAPDGQQLSTFENTPGDPTKLMADILGKLQSGYSDVTSQQAPNLKSSYVQDLPSFAGGGMPMPIGVTGHDPATALAKRAGIGADQNPYLTGGHAFRQATPMDLGGFPSATPDGATGSSSTSSAPSDFTGHGLPQVRRRMSTDLLRAPSANAQPDDLSRALGAADLLRMTLAGH